MTVARKARDASAELERKRVELQALEKASGDQSASFATREVRDWTPECLISIDTQRCVDCGRCFKICGVGFVS